MTAKNSFQSVDEYIASQPEAMQGALESVRSAIRKAVPKAQEVISYNIAAYKLDDGPFLWFAGWKRHYSLYPVGDRLVAVFKDDLTPYDVKKSTIRFPFSAPVPVKLIERIAKFRAKEAGQSAKAKAAKPKGVS
ncbi:MAG TPA: DUF1801 domain-containing protein [Alloacidobacterium sp.]|jgi:uncharacterized protein YdhG (YjbR/CyaY superfamily)|nr:DUF1801 domain-containing protein [Alloacidobacterium sp.]